MARSLGAGEYCRALKLRQSVVNVKLAGGPVDSSRSIRCRFYFRRGGERQVEEPECGAARGQLHAEPGLPSVLTKFGRLPTRTDVETNPPGIVKRLQAKAVVPTLFQDEDERKWQQTFNALFKPR